MCSYLLLSFLPLYWKLPISAVKRGNFHPFLKEKSQTTMYFSPLLISLSRKLNIVDLRIIKAPLYCLHENRNFLWTGYMKRLHSKSLLYVLMEKKSVKFNFLSLSKVIFIKSFFFILYNSILLFYAEFIFILCEFSKVIISIPVKEQQYKI
jgi:hypothetical protein